MKSRFTITCLAAHFTRIAAGDCRDGVLFYTYQKVCFYCDIKYQILFRLEVEKLFNLWVLTSLLFPPWVPLT